jgi:hypothetical protein
VSAYAEQWFEIADDLTEQMGRVLRDSFMLESSSVTDLRSNPLLLSLMCSLYRHQRFIPRNRPQIYASCSRMLFDTWDRSRRLRPAFDFDAHVDGAVQHIAHWIFNSQKLQAGVPEHILVDEAAKYLKECQYNDSALALQAAREFVRFCKSRAWILSDTGTGQNHVSLFQFTHRTFLEYFTAVHIKNNCSEDEIHELVLRRAIDPTWQMVCQILLQLVPDKRQGLADRIVMSLCDLIQSITGTERSVPLALLLRTLESMPLRPASVAAITTSASDEFSMKLAQTRIGGIRADQPVPDREYYWLDGDKVAVENHTSAAGILGTRPNDSMMHDSTPQLELAHLLDFFVVQSCSPKGMRSVLGDENRDRIAAVISGRAWEAWLEAAALMVQIPHTPVRSYEGLTLRNVSEAPIGPVKSPGEIGPCRTVLNLYHGHQLTARSLL